MKNRWLKNVFGYVTVQLIGDGIERFVNRLIKDQVPLWNMKREDEHSITFQMSIQHIPFLKKAVRHHRLKIRFIEKKGLPFLYQKAKSYSGFFLSIFLAILLILLLSNMIWKIEIRGASPELQYKILKQLQGMGIRKGQLLLFVDDPQTIQRKITELNDEITWIGVKLKGTTYYFQVVEKERPEERELASPQHLIAKKEAVIVDYFIEKGQPVIKRNEYVKRGQILVSGVIGTEENKQSIAAEGKVWGKTWYKADVSVKLQSEWKVFTGERKTKKYLEFFHFKLPIWGVQPSHFDQSEIEQTKATIKFLKWTLPISFISETIYEVETVTKTYSYEEAKRLALQKARADLYHQLDEEITIESEKTLHEMKDNGTLKISILFEVIENIAKAQAIIQQN
ncbi:sporulation protein YqfD [Fervidibacillus halotolerans]|uniref:Sporulation protein YqfD n=1 Tax=Fervidibacillus halotolerans TaxID=2980027 RepID=A0A9E8LY07_9BACI|nr:sporulation protein YqfD [Fervidibacillus halotolerans]WAA11497.1 sporulation protein YqfD [Fervidibacillus halotolerans]